MTRLRGVVKRLADEGGYSLTELLTVLMILGTVTGGLTALFLSATNAEVDSNRRFQSQQNARLAFDQLRRDVHCASSATVTNSGATVALTMPAGCTNQPTVMWCALLVSTGRYKLYRKVAASCDTAGKLYADYVTSNVVFTYFAQSTASLAKLRTTVAVNVFPAKPQDSYTLRDDIVLRNSTRT
jgi:Tfp pilus assembly protein PilW